MASVVMRSRQFHDGRNDMAIFDRWRRLNRVGVCRETRTPSSGTSPRPLPNMASLMALHGDCMRL